MVVSAHREQASPAPLTAPGQRCTAALCFHPSPKTMLTLPGALGSLISSFHKSGSWIVASRVGYSERNGCQRSVNVWRSGFGAWRSAFSSCAVCGTRLRFRPFRFDFISEPSYSTAERRTPNAERRTPNAERRTPNAKRRTPNAERQTPNAKRQTPNAKRQTPNAKRQT
jgi:hypothetical protein